MFTPGIQKEGDYKKQANLKKNSVQKKPSSRDKLDIRKLDSLKAVFQLRVFYAYVHARKV